MKSLGRETITPTEETRAIRLLQGLGQGSDIPIVVAMTTLTEIETLTRTEEMREATGATETPETMLESPPTEVLFESRRSMPPQSPTDAHHLLLDDTQKTLTSPLPQARGQIATKTITTTPTTQENQIVKSYSGV
jgi:hypothetical protein